MTLEDKDTTIRQKLDTMQPITLEQMESIRLMNRLDTKYVTSKDKLIELLQLVGDKYYVQEINGDRISPYRTTYLDTDGHAFYLMHHNRRARRVKVRVRTYLSSGDLTFLEVKNKNNHGRTKKKRTRVESLDRCAETLGAADLVKTKSGHELAELHPVVQNHFERITLVNFGKTERLTIDFNVTFHNFENNADRDTGELVIIELKRDGHIFSPVKSLLRDLHIHPTGFSKCCIGMAMTDPTLKRNNFKRKLRVLDDINHWHTT